MQENELDVVAAAQKNLEQRRTQIKPNAQLNGTAKGIMETLEELDEAQSKLGLPDANLIEFYTCEACGQKVERRYFKYFRGGPRFVFPVCSCKVMAREKEQDRQERLKRRREMEATFRQNLMNEDLQAARFSTFEVRPGTALIHRETKRFAEEFESRRSGLLGYGNPGNGKSHLFVSIHHQLDAEEYVCLFLEVPRLFNIIDDARKFSSKVNVNDIINAAIQCDLLTLDELGAGKLTQEEFTDVLFPIINGRQGKKTNYTTNLDLDELREWFATDKFGRPLDNKGRLIDRIVGSCDAIRNEGTSKRMEDAIRRQDQPAGSKDDEEYQARLGISQKGNRTEFTV